ncbi:MAG TPA: hypothetical protein DCL38_06290 [Lachnospiraceae bacterium]|nr:hypothetical protein [Lachnospiraceae bacterium]
MEEWLSGFLKEYKAEYFTAQALTITALFFLGLVFILLVKRSLSDAAFVLLSYPCGLCLYILSGMFLLVFHIRLTHVNILITVFLLLSVSYLMSVLLRRSISAAPGSSKGLSRIKEYSGAERAYLLYIKLPSVRFLLSVTALVLAAALIATSGFISVTVSNDSMYHYSLYSRALVKYGFLKSSYDTFLTDVAPGSALFGTLPFMFGFNESFGLQTALNINFLIIFSFALYDTARGQRGMICGRTCLDRVLTGLMLLVTAQPFLIISKWAMSNMYFMEFLFIGVFMAYYCFTRSGEKTPEDLPVLALLFVTLSFFRMEGMAVALLILLFCVMLSFCVQPREKDKDRVLRVIPRGTMRVLACLVLIPCSLLYGMYYYRVFVFLTVDAPYTFLNETKAALQMAAMLLVLFYFVLPEGKLTAFCDRNMKRILPVGLAVLNLLLFLKDRTLFTQDVEAFFKNLTGMSGWGVFPVFVLSAVIIIIVCDIIDGERPGLSAVDSFVAAYILLTLAVSFARGDPLQDNVGDSGNRVLFQVVPLIVFTLMQKMLRLGG